jgi:uncharacterized membrane protein HdeD (DUF308 family)
MHYENAPYRHNPKMIQRLIVPISICAISLASILQGVLFIDENRRQTGLLFIIAGIITIIATVILHRRGKI